MTDPHLFWATRTYPEIQDAIASGTCVALLPVGATEAHGPHLALDADVTIAVEVARRAARALEAGGLRPLILPPISYTVARFAGEFPGTIGVGEGAARLIFEDVLCSIAAQGIATVAVVNHHLEPAHLEVLRGAIADAPGDMRVVFPDHTRKPHALAVGEKSDEYRRGDCHAGSYETSMVLAAEAAAGAGAARVREDVRATLEPRWLGLVAGIRAGKRTFREVGMDAAYIGDPRAASRAEGDVLLDALASIVVEAVREAVKEP